MPTVCWIWEYNSGGGERSACCLHEVYDLIREGNIITKQGSNFDLDKRQSWDLKSEESMWSRGERSCIPGREISKDPEEGQSGEGVKAQRKI